MNKLNIIFIGGLTNGKVVLDYLLSNKHVSIPLVITHPQEYVGPRHVQISKTIKGVEVINDLDANSYIETIRNHRPDFIFVAGWSGLLSNDLLSIPKNGTIGFHPSKLPKNRGRSVLAWQIEEGYRETALTMFYYNDLPDCGDIIGQEKISIEPNDYINDILNKVDAAVYNLMRAYFPLLRQGNAPRRTQSINDGNFRRLRDDRDSIIDWDQNAEVIFNKIRAISRPYPGAKGRVGSENFRIWQVEIVEDIEKLRNAPPGTVCIEEDEFFVKCRSNSLLLTNYEKE